MSPQIPQFTSIPLGPGFKMGAKGVQARVNSVNYLRLGCLRGESNVKVYHGTVLKELLEDLGVPFNLKEDEDAGRIPISVGKGYQLIGAGSCFWHNGNYEFSGGSGSYECNWDIGRIVELVPLFPKGAEVYDGCGRKKTLLGSGKA